MGRDSAQGQIGRFSIIDLMNKQLATTLKAVAARFTIRFKVDSTFLFMVSPGFQRVILLI